MINTKHIKMFNVFVSSSKFGYLAILLLIIQSAWMALFAIYPLPFDEYYHVGLIKIYALQWSPFIYQQSSEASLYGDITRMPSYLYHYLLSFPYRILDSIFSSEELIIIILRFINILFVVIAVLIFRKLFLKAGISRIVINLCILVFALTPIIPFLAAHVNYDNMMLVGAATCIYLTYGLITDNLQNSKNWLLLLSTGMLCVLVKYPFIVLFLALLGLALWTAHSSSGIKPLLTDIGRDFLKISIFLRTILTILLVTSCLLFTERVIVNIFRYSEPDPTCDAVQSIEVCQQNMPWYRNNQAKLYPDKTSKEFGNPLSFTQHWASKMMRGYFAIFSHTPTNVVSSLEPFGPIVGKPLMPVPITVAYTMLICSIICIIIYSRRIWSDHFLRFIMIVSGVYLAVLWTFNYTSYLRLGEAYAIQARYTYPLLLPIFLVIVTALNQVKVSRNTKLYVAVAVILLYSWGAGVSGWIIRSDSLWYWQNNTVIQVNQRAQNALKMFIPH